MTRPHIRFHRDGSKALHYASRTRETDGAAPEPRFLGGTVPWLGPRRTQACLEAVPRAAPAKTLHIVISLPKGMRLDRAEWTRAISVTFDGLSLPHRRAPWLAFQHTDAACDHAHIVALPLTFSGAPIPFDGTRACCEKADIRLCHHLGLTPPDYPRPGMGPRSGILLPIRRQTSKARKTLAQGIGRSLIGCQPEGAGQLASALQRHGIALTEGDQDWWFAHGSTSVAGHELSTELRSRNLAAIFDHHARLRLLRTALDLKRVLTDLDAARDHLQPILKEIFDDYGRPQRHPDPAHDPAPVAPDLRPAGPDAWSGPEILERLLPLAQLLDLLNRPEDQAQDLGRELSETLKEIAAQMRLMRQAMVIGQEQGTRIEDTLTAMLAQQAEIRKVLEALRAATSRSQAGIVELQDGLLERATD